VDVVLHRRHLDVELQRDVLVRQAVADQSEDLPFAVAELDPCGGAAAARRRQRGDAAEQRCGDAR